MYTIWTDGSYKPSTNSGGYSAIIVKDGKITARLYQGFTNTTNNRMELLAVIMALSYFEQPADLLIYSDSQYVVNSVNNGYVYDWVENTDLTKKNLDLWVRLVELLKKHTVKFEWVKGHANNEMNHLADLYAQHASSCLNIKNDIEPNNDN